MIPKSQLIKRMDAMLGGGSSPSSSSILSAVSFEKNRLYYNGETYHLQFGWNKRIMCVTKGDKYAIINSPDYTGSRIEAATAVMKGLIEDWDLEYDFYADSGENRWLNLSTIVSGFSGVTKCDWGDGTTDSSSEHDYGSTTGAVRVKAKFSGDISTASISIRGNHWKPYSGINPLYIAGIGQTVHIGGNFENITLAIGEHAGDYLTFGEKVKRIGENSDCGYTYGMRIPHGHQHGIPPFVEYIGKNVFQYSGSGYIYIPKSCTQIGDGAFNAHNAEIIEIEAEGAPISLGKGCFQKTNASYGASTPMVGYISIPARATATGNEIMRGCGAIGLKFGSGTTAITAAMVNESDISYGKFGSIIDTIPFFLFIPNTANTIDINLISNNSKRPVYIICEGTWNGSESRENITVIEWASECYNNAEDVINTFIGGK